MFNRESLKALGALLVDEIPTFHLRLKSDFGGLSRKYKFQKAN